MLEGQPHDPMRARHGFVSSSPVTELRDKALIARRLRPDLCTVPPARLDGRAHRLKFLITNLDLERRITRLQQGLRNHKGHRITRQTHLVSRKYRGTSQRDVVRATRCRREMTSDLPHPRSIEVRRRVNRKHPRHFHRPARRHRHNSCMRMR